MSAYTVLVSVREVGNALPSWVKVGAAYVNADGSINVKVQTRLLAEAGFGAGVSADGETVTLHLREEP